MNHLDPSTAPAGAADYQLARSAALDSEPVASLHHLEQAVERSPVYAAVAFRDPAFQNMRGPVAELAARLNLTPGATQPDPAGTYRPAAGMTQPLAQSSTPLAPTSVSELPPSLNQTPVVQEPLPILQPNPNPAPKPVLPLVPPLSGSPVSLPPVSIDPLELQSQRQPVPPPARSPAPSPQPPSAHDLPRAASAALDLDLLQSWDNAPARAAASSEYQLARAAMETGDRPAALQHLEQAILAHHSQAALALADPAFEGIREPVRDLVTRLTQSARLRAEASIAEFRELLQFAGGRQLASVRAYLQSAQTSFQLGTYTGYVQAALAAGLAARITKEKVRSRRWAFGPLAAAPRIMKQAARRLWLRLPLLAILLGWLLAGVAAAVVSLPFGAGAAFRAWLLPVWAIGLVSIVLFGFVRSIRAMAGRRA